MKINKSHDPALRAFFEDLHAEWPFDVHRDHSSYTAFRIATDRQTFAALGPTAARVALTPGRAAYYATRGVGRRATDGNWRTTWLVFTAADLSAHRLELTKAAIEAYELSRGRYHTTGRRRPVATVPAHNRCDRCGTRHAGEECAI